ncbi:MAG TPA: hypothetical protein VMZ69_10270 [Saprospiraceae bacterium]|nr:hypothetical protein [Saprospiraceae bacterium]
MKTQLFLMTLMFLIANSVAGQPDKQWLIWNKLGKEGTQPDGIFNKYQNTINNASFTLFNVRQASYIPVTRPARTDLFIIYEDGTHYNSRNVADPGFFRPTTTSLASYTNHNFTANHSAGNVAYGYLSRSYEGDDPPGSVRAASASGGQNNPPFTFTETTYTAGIELPNDTLLANHDVVKGKDITLIIDQSKLALYAKQRNMTSNFYLVFDELSPARPEFASVAKGNYFAVEPIFFRSTHHADEAGYPVNTFSYNSTNPERVQLVYDANANKQYTYINLRPTSAIDSYGPDEKGARYNAIFKIVDGSNQTITRTSEAILMSFDPNLIRVDSVVCNGPDQIVYYYLQFQNTSPLAAATVVTTSVSFPSQFDLSTFQVSEYSIRGNRVNGGITPQADGRTYTFTFGGNSSLSVCASPFDVKDCTGFVKFSVNVPGRINLRSTSNSLQLLNPQTNFDGNIYPIEIFEDWVTRDSDHPRHWIRPIDCGGGNSVNSGGEILCWISLFSFLMLLLFVLWVVFFKSEESVQVTT